MKAGRLYYVVLAFGGKRKWIPAGRRRIDAERVLAEELGKTLKGPYKEIKRISFRDFALRWLAEYAELKVKESTYREYESSIRVHLIPFFEDSPLNAIGLEDVQRFINLKVRKGEQSAKTMNNMLVPLKEMFKHAVRWGYVVQNPCEYVEKPRVIHKEMNFLSKQEILKLLDHVPEENRIIVLMACLSDLRRGELFAMKWSNLNLDRGQYFVKESLYRGYFVEPKTKKPNAPRLPETSANSGALEHRARQLHRHPQTHCRPQLQLKPG